MGKAWNVIRLHIYSRKTLNSYGKIYTQYNKKHKDSVRAKYAYLV